MLFAHACPSSLSRRILRVFVLGALWVAAAVPGRATEETWSPALRHAPEMEVTLVRPDSEPRALVLFGSGDGGWSPWESTVTGWLAEDGCAVVRFDFRTYGKSDYSQELLAGDFAQVAEDALKRLERPDLPVLYGGWSMGAVQAVAAAAKPQVRPAWLRGLLLLSADSRGRYGIRATDLVGITPRGEKSFALSEFNASLDGLRVAQFHGTADFMASSAWIGSLGSAGRLYRVAGANHGFDGPSAEFRPILLSGLEWILGAESQPWPETAGSTSPLWPLAAGCVFLTGLFLVSRQRAVTVLAATVVVMGALNLAGALLPRPEPVWDRMELWVPLQVTQHSRWLLLLAGATLLLLARGLERRKRAAWAFAMVVLGASALLHLVTAFDWPHAVASLVLMLPLIRWRRQFQANSDAPSLVFGLCVAVGVLAGVGGYGTVAIHQAGKTGAFGEPVTWGRAGIASFSLVSQLPESLEEQAGRQARHLFQSLRLDGLAAGVVALAAALRPVVVRRGRHGLPEERERAAAIIARHGADPMDEFALLPDKFYFFAPGGEGFVAYALWRRYAVALADPICAPEARAGVIRAFSRFCRRQDWHPVFYCGIDSNRAAYEQLGFSTLKIGEDARLDLATFRLEGTRFQNLRTARNKARRNGVTFGWYDATQGVDTALEAELRAVSDDWLARKHGGEMTFDLGAFRIEEIRARGVGYARDAQGKLQAFATWLPYARGTGRTLDIMRGLAQARDLIDFVILESIDHFRALGVVEVSLGNAPLANTAGPVHHRDRAVRYLFENFDHFYGYKRLFAFKQKYQPDWRGRFLAYPRDAHLPAVGMAVAGVHLPGGFWGLLRS